MAIRVCACIGCTGHPGSCPQLTTQRHCDTCRPVRERARGTRQQRGYGKTHDALRARLNRRVQTGTVRCARCQELIQPGTEWALDHTDDRTGYLGASHATCNNAAGGRAAHGG